MNGRSFIRRSCLSYQLFYAKESIAYDSTSVLLALIPKWIALFFVDNFMKTEVINSRQLIT